MPGTTRRLVLHDLHCTLGTRKVLRGLSTNPIEPGQVVAVLGRNGVGKSTLLRCIAGFIPCRAGRIHLNETDLLPLSPAQRANTVRYLPQAGPGPLHLTVRECLLVALNARHLYPNNESKRQIAAISAELGLEPLMSRNVDELSGGQKQLVWLGQALLHQPAALLLDEPLAALDPHHQHHVMSLLRRLAAKNGLLVLIVLHDLNIAVRHTDQVLVLHEGTVISQGPPQAALTPSIMQQAFLMYARVEHCSQGRPMVIVDGPL